MAKYTGPIQLTIPQPCTQAWEEMQPIAGGRHCASCEKVVTDFSRMTDAQLLDYFQAFNGTGCGRFTAEQLDRVIHAVEVPRSTWWARVAAGLVLGLGCPDLGYGQVKVDDKANQVQPSKLGIQYNQNRGSPTSNSGEIFGILKDHKGNPVINANVEVLCKGMVVGRGLTDFDGLYRIGFPSSYSDTSYDVKFSYQHKEQLYTDLRPANNAPLQVNGKLNLELLESTVRITMGRMAMPLIDLNKTEPMRIDRPASAWLKMKRQISRAWNKLH